MDNPHSHHTHTPAHPLFLLWNIDVPPSDVRYHGLEGPRGAVSRGLAHRASGCPGKKVQGGLDVFFAPLHIPEAHLFNLAICCGSQLDSSCTEYLLHCDHLLSHIVTSCVILDKFLNLSVS